MKNKNKFLHAFLVSSIVLMCYVGTDIHTAESAPSAICGNGSCEFGETAISCPADCNSCGDGTCDEAIGETPVTCNVDCLGSVCGDGTCDVTESVATCPRDCTLPSPTPDPGTSTPSCEDVTLSVGEKTTCSVKVENAQIFPITEVIATVVIPQEIIKVDHTDSWSCSSIAAGTKCQKLYNPYLLIGEIDYLELTFSTDAEGQYGVSASVDGKGESFQTVTYSSSEEITITEPVTANAVDDNFMNMEGPVVNFPLGANDTLCSSGTTTFEYFDEQGTVEVGSFDSNAGIASFTTTCSEAYLFQYRIRCNGVITDTAVVRNMCA